MWNIINYYFNFFMFAIALGLGPLETITIAISAIVFIAAFTWVSIKGDLRELANELIDEKTEKEEN
ncbi:possible Photosystem II reaction centre N protein [Prochlorococcus marinus str. MIT 9515]|uniref:Possible Photosystem II reaction centre N protein n=2 Tax=Prochlorococcus marinus TaxID=1219 RepID=A2BWY3_PROM5|nr:possible Photosystem II reaction centre N protein [Prochlorococcus marinus str. MIT 9515]